MKGIYKHGYFILLTGLLFGSCTKQLYREALLDASHPTPQKISQQLTPITHDNADLLWSQFEDFNGVPADFVLMASWKNAKDTTRYLKDTISADGRRKFYDTKLWPVFVTAYPDLQNWYAAYADHGDIHKRLTQLLGLPPDAAERVFVLFWVRPQDLIRPCVDPEVTDNACDFKINNSTGNMTECENLIWLTQFIRDSYSDADLYKQYPFTQLGYTYDWKKNNKQHVGMSEFVIGKNKMVRIAGIYGTDEFLKIKKGDLHLD